MNGFYLTADEELLVNCQTRLTGVTVGLVAYEVTPNSRRILTTMNMPLTGSGTIDSFSIRAGPALLDSVQVYISAGTVIKGEVAVGVKTRRLSGAIDLLGSVSSIVFPSTNYPAQALFTSSLGMIDSGWVDKLITGTDPAAGAELSETVPTGVDWILEVFRGVLVTEVTAATRQVFLVITDGTTTYLTLAANGTQIASLTRTYNFAHLSSVPALTGTIIHGPLQLNHILGPGYILTTTNSALQALDNWGAPIMKLRERLTLAR